MTPNAARRLADAHVADLTLHEDMPLPGLGAPTIGCDCPVAGCTTRVTTAVLTRDDLAAAVTAHLTRRHWDLEDRP